jgi:hypothetical protein
MATQIYFLFINMKSEGKIHANFCQAQHDKKKKKRNFMLVPQYLYEQI